MNKRTLPSASGEDLEKEIFEAMRLESLLLPQTVGEVMRAERQIAKANFKLPVELSELGVLLAGSCKPRPQPGPSQTASAYQPACYQPFPYPLAAYPAPASSRWKTPLFTAVAILLAVASGQFYYFNSQLGQFRSQMNDRLDSLDQKIAQEREESNVSLRTSRRYVDNLKKDLDAARAQASQLAGQAKVDATKHADEIASRLSQAQEQQAKQVTAVTADLSQVKDQASATQGRVGEVSGQVDTLKTEQASTRQELEKTIADLKRTNGDLGVQSGLIATNGKELAALKALGARNYTEFKLAKEKSATKVGDIMVRLKDADPERNRYTIDLIADDKTIEKKDRSTNEPLQFYLSRAAQPYELVVYEVHKDLIIGYVSAPKVQQARKTAFN